MAVNAFRDVTSEPSSGDQIVNASSAKLGHHLVEVLDAEVDHSDRPIEVRTW